MSVFTMTERDDLDFRVNDALTRMLAAPNPAIKVMWAKRANQARRDRGDFDHLVAARREKLDQAEERHD